MVTRPTESGDIIRDQAEATGERLVAAKELLVELLVKAPVEPREVMRFAGLILQELDEAAAANDVVKQIIYDNRRRK